MRRFDPCRSVGNGQKTPCKQPDQARLPTSTAQLCIEPRQMMNSTKEATIFQEWTKYIALAVVCLLPLYASPYLLVVSTICCPSLDASRTSPIQAFCVSERFQPPGQGSTYLKIKGREAWVLQRSESEDSDACTKLPPPMDEVRRVLLSGDWPLCHSPRPWRRVAGVRVYMVYLV